MSARKIIYSLQVSREPSHFGWPSKKTQPVVLSSTLINLMLDYCTSSSRLGFPVCVHAHCSYCKKKKNVWGVFFHTSNSFRNLFFLDGCGSVSMATQASVGSSMIPPRFPLLDMSVRLSPDLTPAGNESSLKYTVRRVV